MSNSKYWRSTREYRLWRVTVIRRDKVCQACGDRSGRHAHHIESANYNPALVFDVGNGICLCALCHMKYHTDFNRSYRVKTTRYNLDNFLSLMRYAISKGESKALKQTIGK